MRRLVAYRWPGNIRELENMLERAVILATGPTLDFEIDAEPSAGPAVDRQEIASLSSLEAVERPPYRRRPPADALGHRRAARRGPGSWASIPIPSAAG